jgi:putative Mg2+ transporter-C (MgtC) family protein
MVRGRRGYVGRMDWEPVLRILAAAAMSLPIGFDREMHGKPAGLRTHLLLATSTAALGYLSVDLAEGREFADPTRIASYVVAGIGFLGAGLIVGVRGRVYGLTTAVGAFSVMAVGVLTGTGYGMVALALTVVSLLFLWPVEWLKPRTYGRVARVESTLTIVVSDPTGLADVLAAPAAHGIEIRGVDVDAADPVIVVQLTLRATTADLEHLCHALGAHAATTGRPAVSGASSGDLD